MTTPRDRLIDSLQDRDFREAYVAEHLHQGFAFQVKATRKGRGLTQEELGDLAGMKQSRISDIEDPSYESLNLKTAKRLASALNVALILRLVAYSKFTDFLTGSTSISSGEWVTPVPSFDDDAELRRETPEATAAIVFWPHATAPPYQQARRFEDFATNPKVEIDQPPALPVQQSAVARSMRYYG